MASITMTAVEVEGYRLAVDLDDFLSIDSPAKPFESVRFAEKLLKARGITGSPDKITVTFSGDARVPNIYELHYDAGA
jgi:hypothetical protein